VITFAQLAFYQCSGCCQGLCRVVNLARYALSLDHLQARHKYLELFDWRTWLETHSDARAHTFFEAPSSVSKSLYKSCGKHIPDHIFNRLELPLHNVGKRFRHRHLGPAAILKSRRVTSASSSSSSSFTLNKAKPAAVSNSSNIFGWSLSKAFKSTMNC